MECCVCVGRVWGVVKKDFKEKDATWSTHRYFLMATCTYKEGNRMENYSNRK